MHDSYETLLNNLIKREETFAKSILKVIYNSIIVPEYNIEDERLIATNKQERKELL